MEYFQTQNQSQIRNNPIEIANFKINRYYEGQTIHQVICVSPNLRYLGLFYSSYFQVIDYEGKTVVQVESEGKFINCCFSDDSKLACIQFFAADVYYFITLYDLQNKKRIWILRFESEPKIINFSKNMLICQFEKKLQIITFTGIVKYQLPLNFLRSTIFIDFKDKLCQIINICCMDLNNQNPILLSFINCTFCCFQLKKKRIAKDSRFIKQVKPQLNFLNIYLGQCLKDMVRNGNQEQYFQENFQETQFRYYFSQKNKFIINDRIFFFKRSGFYQQNILLGRTEFFQTKCPKQNQINSIQEPYFCVSMSKNFWKENLQEKSVEYKIYKI